MTHRFSLIVALSLFVSLVSAQPVFNWEVKYNNQLINNKDEWIDMEVDGAGNSYLIGKSIGQGTGYDIIVSKVNNQGSIVWTYRYNGTANQTDVGTDIEIDSQSNVYCIGTVTNTGTSQDAVIFKLNPTNGSLLWDYVYDGIVSGVDKANSVSVSNNGTRIALAGETDGGFNDRDAIFIILNQNGQLINAEINQGGYDKTSRFVEFFNNGNMVFVSEDSSHSAQPSGPYSIQLELEARSSSGGNPTFGYSTNSVSDIIRPRATYMTSSEEVFIAAEGIIDNQNISHSIQVYKVGNAGINGTITYEFYWYWDAGVDEHHVTDIVVDGLGKIYVSGSYDADPTNGIDLDGFILCFNSDYSYSWFRSIVGTGTDVIEALFPDNQTYSSVYGTVTSTAQGTNDIGTFSLDNTNGNVEWYLPYNGPDGNSDIAKFIHVDNSGTFRVGGMSNSNATNDDGILLMYCTPPVVALNPYNGICINANPIQLSGGSPTGGTYSGTGVTNGSFNPQTAGVGTHIITYEYINATGCSAEATRPIVVHALPPTPTVSANGPVQFCNGGSVVLSAPSGYSYSWSPGNGVAQNLTVSTSGNYSVTISDQYGCQTSSMPTSVTTIPLPSVNAGSDVSICFGDSATLTSVTTASSCTWTPTTGLANPINCSTNASPSTDTQYSVEVTDINTGCTNIDNVLVSVISNQAPTPIIEWPLHSYISNSLYVEFELSNAGQFDYVEWDFGDSSPVETGFSPSHTFASFETGYVVTATGCIVCDTDTICSSETQLVDVTSVQANEMDNRLSIYPNPSTGMFTIQTSGNSHPIRYEVTDQLGRLVTSGGFGASVETVNLFSVGKGMYIVQVYYEGAQVQYERLILIR
ncbi:MAG: T9SS type A sorting domain-containing protein [Flavobacteriales bacterium]|nr:T9SS type A sorting domain-containing protein [Flavobacteriales bacterium]